MYDDGENNDKDGVGGFDSSIVVDAVASAATFFPVVAITVATLDFFYNRIIICIDLISENVLKNVTI